MILSPRFCTIVIVVIATSLVTQARVSSRSKQYPACYTDASNWAIGNDNTSDCKHPLYQNCRNSDRSHLCCGPDHYCCNYSTACCRRNPWTVYEVVGMATGILSWVCILVVLSLCLGPLGVKSLRRVFKRFRKVHPQKD